MFSVFTLTYLIVFILALVNNSLALAAILRNTQLRTVTNYFLMNLAIADITVSIVVLPITLLSNIFSEWLFGPFLCKAVPYFQGVAVCASVNTLVVVAIERYLAICYPQTTLITPRRALGTIFIIWIVAFFIQTPWLVFYRQRTFGPSIVTGEMSTTVCFASAISGGYISEKWLVVGVFMTCYVIPLSLIIVFYCLIGTRVWQRRVQGIGGSQVVKKIQQSKIRVTVMLVVVAAVFAMSWLPLYAIQIKVMFGRTMTTWEREVIQNTLSPLSQWLGSANSCVNPIIYCFFSRSFRKSFFQFICVKPTKNSSRQNIEV